MKAVLFSDNLNSLHLTMLKSVLLVLSLLPVSHFIWLCCTNLASKAYSAI